MNIFGARLAVQPPIAGCRPSSFPALSAANPRNQPAPRLNSRPVLRCCGLALIVLAACNSARAEHTSGASAHVVAASDPIAVFIAEAAKQFDIPEHWIRSVMQVESAGDTHALSPKGAMGLMQIMPDTWADLRVRYGLGADPFDPHDNIIAGAAYLRELHDRYGEAGFLAAYNAGPVRYEEHLATGRPLPVETQNYIAVLAPMMSGGGAFRTIRVDESTRPWTDASLFTGQVRSNQTSLQSPITAHVDDSANGTAASDWTALAPQSDGLFVATSARIARP